MVRDFFSKLLRREISSFARISVTVAPFTRAAVGIRPLPFDRVQAGEGHDDTPRIGIMKSAPQCGPGKSRSTTVRNDTLLCICLIVKADGNLLGGMWRAGHTAGQ